MENEISIAKKIDSLLKLPKNSGLSTEDRRCLSVFASGIGLNKVSDAYASEVAEEYLSEKTKKKIHMLHDKFLKEGK